MNKPPILADGSAFGALLSTYELAAPVTLDDVHAIYEDILSRLSAGYSCCVQLRSITPLYDGPEHVEIRIRYKSGDLAGELFRIAIIGAEQRPARGASETR